MICFLQKQNCCFKFEINVQSFATNSVSHVPLPDSLVILKFKESKTGVLQEILADVNSFVANLAC